MKKNFNHRDTERRAEWGIDAAMPCQFVVGGRVRRADRVNAVLDCRAAILHLGSFLCVLCASVVLIFLSGCASQPKPTQVASLARMTPPPLPSISQVKAARKLAPLSASKPPSAFSIQPSAFPRSGLRCIAVFIIPNDPDPGQSLIMQYIGLINGHRYCLQHSSDPALAWVDGRPFLWTLGTEDVYSPQFPLTPPTPLTTLTLYRLKDMTPP